MMMRRLAVLLLLAACVSNPAAPLRILTYNIHAGKDAAGKDNLERVAKIIAESKADIVLLQEVDRGTTRSGKVDQLAELVRLTGMHGQFGKSLDYQGGEYGIAILSRWPITAHEIVPLRVEPPAERAGGSHEPRIALAVTTNGWRIVNTHLDASRDDRYRMQEVPQVLAAARDAIAGGDFNATPDAAVHAAVMRAGLRDAWSDCGSGNEFTYAQKRIDYVFLRGRCESARVIDTDASDHRPLLVETKIRARTASPGRVR
jgi:endonuclease/exonuclease/phosphatase family metal-dependent hydrolase